MTIKPYAHTYEYGCEYEYEYATIHVGYASKNQHHMHTQNFKNKIP